MARGARLNRAMMTLIVACMVMAAGCVSVSEGERMQSEIDAMKAEQRTTLESFKKKEAELAQTVAMARGEVKEIKRVLAEATELLQKNSANVGADVEEMRREIEMLRGRNEEIGFRLDKLDNDLKIYKEDVELRFSGAAKEELPEGADELLKMAIGKVGAKDFRGARRALEAFVTRHPKDRRADVVTYLLGETYFLEKQYISAVFEYQKILKNYPKSGRVDDAKYRIGESMFNLGKCPQAKIFFTSVIKDHKRSSFAKQAKAQIQLIDAGKCP